MRAKTKRGLDRLRRPRAEPRKKISIVYSILMSNYHGKLKE